MYRRRPHGSKPETVTRQCTATSKRTSERCRKPAMRGRATCRAHGGATPRGTESPAFRHGRYSRDLPHRLAERYDRAQQDPALLELRDEIGLVDALLQDALSKLRWNESTANMERIRQAWNPLHRELRRKEPDPDTVRDLAGSLSHVIAAGCADAGNRTVVRQLIGDRLRLVESERKREQELEQHIPVEQMLVVMTAVGDAISRMVPSADLRRDILAELDALLNLPGRAPEPPAC